MMNRFVFTFAGRNLPKAVYLRSIAVQNLYSPLSPSVCLLESRKAYSTKVSVLKKIVPEFWIMKMKTAFVWHDVNDKGYIIEQDFASFIEEMIKLFPDMTEEQKELLEAKHGRVWGDFLEGKGKGPDYKVTESMYIEKCFDIVNKEGAEDMVRKEWHNSFTYQDTNQDGVISKAEHRRFFEAMKHIDPNGAIVAFSAIDKDMDGVISRDEYVEAAVEYFFNFSDETKPSKYFFGPLVKA